MANTTNLLKKEKSSIFDNNKTIINNSIRDYKHQVIDSAVNFKVQKIKINKFKINDISTEKIDRKYKKKINTEVSNSSIMNNTISDFKLNSSKYFSKKIKKEISHQQILKEMKSVNKRKYGKNIINNKKKLGLSDSYEFNFTFNNYNNNYTQNNFGNVSEIENYERITKKTSLDNFANKTIINNFSSVRNKILEDIRKIINKENDKMNKKQKIKTDLKPNSKIAKIEVIRKNKTRNNDIYAIKIQKIFRGYIFRKKNQKVKMKRQRKNVYSSFGVYIRKKILNKKKQSLNINDNIISNHSYITNNFAENHYAKNQITEIPNNKTIQVNQIEEIIINKNKLLKALGPSKKRNDSGDFGIKNKYIYKFGVY